MRKFKQIIGGTQKDAYAKFPWLKEAKFKNAIVDITNSYLIWIDGIWIDGVWEYGEWKDGEWKDGVWKNGVWFNGKWFGGTWEDGTWANGVWENGIWEDGYWANGAWEGGTWKKGWWEYGTWEGGTWKKGIMWIKSKQKFVKASGWDKDKKEFILEEDIKNKTKETTYLVCYFANNYENGSYSAGNKFCKINKLTTENLNKISKEIEKEKKLCNLIITNIIKLEE